jgi:uncharacterized protein
LSEPPAEDGSYLVDLTGMTLERIARLCDPAAGLDPDGLEDRPVLRRALLRVREETERGQETFAGFNNKLFLAMAMQRPRQVPLREFVLKVASRCDLACDYCYVYTGPDQTWRSQPAVMSPPVIDATATRIGEHARAHGLASVQVGLHGGEPLLAGAATLEHVLSSVRGAVPQGTRVDLAAQTNGVLLNREFLRLFARHQVRVGVSLDGDAAANDRHRVRANGRSSHTDVVHALSLLTTEQHRPLFAGVLCTIDLANDPLTTYRTLAGFRPPTVDFLLPHANWSRPPPRPSGSSDTPYADWLIPIFDVWYSAPGTGTRVRLFEEMLQLILGGTSAIEVIGGSPAAFAVVQTDGGIEGMDSLKSTYDGAPTTGMSVLTDSFDEALRHPAIAEPWRGREALGATCRSCPVVDVCGGGQYAHRYRAGHGFGQPSVYCADLRRLIGHIAGRVHADLCRAGTPPR